MTPGAVATPDVPEVLRDERSPYRPQPPWPDAEKSGRRLAFARWLTRPDHPLTSRVLVNRLWRRHFGEGLVRSLDNFGATGVPPSHPELLDWLAVRFAQTGFHWKPMHRLMTTSTAYRQSSQRTPDRMRLDPDNRRLSRMPLGRLDAEALRDALLATAGRLDLSAFGPPEAVTAHADGLVSADAKAESWRRSIYVLQRRTETLTILETFDLPQMSPNCVQRSVSTVAPQALHLLNDDAVHQLSHRLAERVADEAGENSRERIQRLFQIALARPPSEQELVQAEQALAQLSERWRVNGDEEGAASPEDRALANLSHALMNSAAFLYLD